MNIRITGKNIELTDALKEKVEEKISKLQKFFHKDIEAYVTLKVQKLDQIVEVTIPMKGTILRTEVKDKDMYVAIDKALDILEKQLIKYKGKLRAKHKQDNVFMNEYIESESAGEDPDDLIISKVKNFELKPMSDEEAILQMNLLEHDFYIYMDQKENLVKVVYRKKDGTYGLIVAH